MSGLSHSTTLTSSVPIRSMQPAQQVWDRRFYLIMAIASTVLVFLAFARTFYLKPYFGTPQLSRLVELHGIVFTAWMFFSSHKLLSLPRTARRFTDGLATRAES